MFGVNKHNQIVYKAIIGNSKLISW